MLGYEGEKGLYHLAAEHLLQQMEEKYPVEELFLLVPSSVFPSLGQKQNTMFTVLSTTHPPLTANFLKGSRPSWRLKFDM